jgi:sarcosine oxidase subunit gamma
VADGHSLPARLSPFATLFADIGNDENAGVTLTPRVLEQVQIDCRPERAGTILFPLPTAGHARAHEGLRLISLAPQRWMAIAPDGADLERRVRVACVASGAAVVDQSHARAVLRIAGSHARDVLAKGCGLDLHPAAFAGDRVASTALFHVAVTVDRRRGGGVFDLHMPRGFARSLAERLVDAAREHGVAIAG